MLINDRECALLGQTKGSVEPSIPHLSVELFSFSEVERARLQSVMDLALNLGMSARAGTADNVSQP